MKLPGPRHAARKNALVRGVYLRNGMLSEILPGAAEYLQGIRACGVKTALGSASKNASLILERLSINPLFDVIMDGNKVSQAKTGSGSLSTRR